MRPAIVILALSLAALSARGQETPGLILLNGAPLRGEVIAVRPDGVEVRAGAATRLHPWSAFAPGTRYRFDPLYRANLTAAQQGLPVARWPNPPDGEYSAQPRPLAGPATTSAAGATDVRPLSFTALPPIPARPRNSLVTLDPKAGAQALSWGLRYGPAESDTAFFILESAGADGLPPAMHVWTAADKRPERITASRRADGDEARAVFREQRFRGAREDVQVEYRVSVSASTRMPGALLVNADVQLQKGAAISSFSLVGAPPGVLSGDGAVAARDLLAPPSLVMALDTIDGKPVFAGGVRMGRLRLIPRSGMDRALSVTISEERGAEVIKESVAFTGDAPADKHSFALPLQSLKSGGKYSLRARIDLGPFLGPVEYQESFVMK